MSSSQTTSQELCDMRNTQPLETDQPKAQNSMGKPSLLTHAETRLADPLQILKRPPRLQNPPSNFEEVVPAMVDSVASFLARSQSTAGSSLAHAVKRMQQ
ncbi:hypothetical protein ACHAPO_006095 [Fusarium lateritium]